MTILAIDSSIGISSVAILREDDRILYREQQDSTKQAALLMPLIESALAEAGLAYHDLTRVVSTVGPGSFTGIRIGLAAARGIAFAASLPCTGYTTLEVMAHATGAANALAILNAGKGEVFYQYFGSPSAPAIGTLDEVLARYPGASIASSLPLPEGFATPTITHPRADALAALAFAHPDRALPATPFYIRPPDAKPSIPALVAGSGNIG